MENGFNDEYMWRRQCYFLLFPLLCQYGRGTCTDTMKQKIKPLFLGLSILAFTTVLVVVAVACTFVGIDLRAQKIYLQ